MKETTTLLIVFVRPRDSRSSTNITLKYDLAHFSLRVDNTLNLMRIKKKHLTFISFSMLGVILSGEAFCRFYLGLGTPPLSIQHPTIEYLYVPNQDVYPFKNHFVTNEYGMRSEPFSKQKGEDELRVLVFGDSVINGGSLTDQSHLATVLLKEHLEKASYKDVVVGNISAGSWGPGNWLAYAQEYGFFEADIVVLVVSSHDYADNPSFSPLNENTHPSKKMPSALMDGIFRYLPRYLPRTEDSTAVKHRNSFFEKQHGEDALKGISDLKQFLQLAKKQSNFVLVSQHWEKVEIDNRAASSGNVQIQEACSQIGIKVISLQPYFQKAVDDGVNPYRDNIHPNDFGQRLISEAIFDNIPKVYFSN